MLTPDSAMKAFGFGYGIDDLDNDLRLITVPTDFPRLVTLYIVVNAGSRNEVEPGKSGFAHLFEHLMFRGTERFSTERYDRIMKAAGADRNAYTSDDRTVYHTVFSKEDLDTILMLEADRFQNLRVPVELFKTETRAVLGEYNKNASNPVNKLFEVLRDTSFEQHPYKHTTMGCLSDIQKMPDLYDYSLQFFDRYYRPEYTTIIVVGDISGVDVRGQVEKHWGGWNRGSYAPEIPFEPEQNGERSARVAWPAPTLPWIAVAFKGPAYSDTEKDMAAMDLIGNLGFAQNSELYQRLVIREQKVDAMINLFEGKRDPYIVSVLARVKDATDLDYVKDSMLRTFESFKTGSIEVEMLEAVKSHLRYSFALSLDSSPAIAAALAPYVALRRTPETVNRLYDLYSSITPEDLREIALRYFEPNKRTSVILQHR